MGDRRKLGSAPVATPPGVLGIAANPGLMAGPPAGGNLCAGELRPRPDEVMGPCQQTPDTTAFSARTACGGDQYVGFGVSWRFSLAEAGLHPGRAAGAEPCAWSLSTAAPPVRPREVGGHCGGRNGEPGNDDHGAFPWTTL
jgi:hypothetical protein